MLVIVAHAADGFNLGPPLARCISLLFLTCCSRLQLEDEFRISKPNFEAVPAGEAMEGISVVTGGGKKRKMEMEPAEKRQII